MRKSISIFMILVMILFLGVPVVTLASEDLASTETNNTLDSEGGVVSITDVYESTNMETGYRIQLCDMADLLTPSEEEELIEVMLPISAYGNVAFVSIETNPTYSTERYVESYYEENFGYSSGTVFIIDMDERYIWIHSNGEIYKTITDAYATTITDNVYSYASAEDYLSCASVAFEQINTLLEGRTIAQPMKYISNALLAIVLALLINYFLVMMLSRSRKASTSQLINGTFYKADIKNPRAEFIKQTKRYSPQSSGSSGGGRSGGGGGGGSRGGGGGHRF